jgi:hypothetical protein
VEQRRREVAGRRTQLSLLPSLSGRSLRLLLRRWMTRLVSLVLYFQPPRLQRRLRLLLQQHRPSDLLPLLLQRQQQRYRRVEHAPSLTHSLLLPRCCRHSSWSSTPARLDGSSTSSPQTSGSSSSACPACPCQTRRTSSSRKKRRTGGGRRRSKTRRGSLRTSSGREGRRREGLDEGGSGSLGGRESLKMRWWECWWKGE